MNKLNITRVTNYSAFLLFLAQAGNLIVLTVALTGSSYANAFNASFNAAKKATEDNFKTLAQIEAALNPLEKLANHGGVGRSIDLNIQFALNSAQILPAAQRQIDALGKALTRKVLSHCAIKLTGHTDASGNANTNLALSQQRSFTVKQRLIKQYNIPSKQLTAVGKGENQLLPKLAPNNAKHRRVEIALVNVAQCKKIAHLTQKKEIKDNRGQLKIAW